MGKVIINGEITDLAILERNKILFKEIGRAIKPHQEEMVLYQGYTLGKPSLAQGRLINLSCESKEEGGLYCLYFNRPLHYWFNEDALVLDFNKAGDGFPINYNGGGLARLLDSRGKVLFEDEEEVKNWTKELRVFDIKNKHPYGKNQALLRGLIGLMSTYGIDYSKDAAKVK